MKPVVKLGWAFYAGGWTMLVGGVMTNSLLRVISGIALMIGSIVLMASEDR